MATDTPDLIKVFAKTLSGNQYAVDISKEATVAELKKQLEAASGVPVSKIRLIFRGKSLDDSHKLGPQCQIENENVVHMVEKTVPVDAAGARPSDANLAQTSSSAGGSPNAHLGASPGSGAPHAHPQGPNLVIRTVQFGWDPTAAQQMVHPNAAPNSGASSPDPSQSASSAGSSPAPSATPSPNPGQNFLQNIMSVASQAAATMFGVHPQPGSGTTSPAPNANPDPNQSRAAQGVPQNPPQNQGTNIAQLRINIPAVPTTTLIHSLADSLETQLLPQFENLIVTLGRDITDFGPEGANLIPRVYEIRPPAGINLAPLTANSTEPSATLQSLWKRYVKIQTRWVDIIQAVEGHHTLYDENPTITPALPASLPPSRLISTNTTSTGLPLLDLPLGHPLRHLLEHWAPSVGAQISNLHQTLFPLLTHHHMAHHHRPQNQAAPGSSSTPTPSTSTNRPEARNSTTSPAPTSTGSAPPAPNPADEVEDFDDMRQELENLIAKDKSNDDELDAAADELMASLMESPSHSPAPSGTASSAPQLSSPQPLNNASQSSNNLAGSNRGVGSNSTSVASSAAPSAASEPSSGVNHGLSNEELWASWREVIERDIQAQKKINTSRPQQPFSDAYEQPTYSGVSSGNEAQELLQEVIQEAEETIPGATANGLPLSNTPIPPVLLSTFNHRLERYIQQRLSSDPDWQALRDASETSSRYPHLSNIHSKPSQ